MDLASLHSIDQRFIGNHTRCLGSFCMPPVELLPRVITQLREQGGVLRLRRTNAVCCHAGACSLCVHVPVHVSNT